MKGFVLRARALFFFTTRLLRGTRGHREHRATPARSEFTVRVAVL